MQEFIVFNHIEYLINVTYLALIIMFELRNLLVTRLLNLNAINVSKETRLYDLLT